MMWDFSIGHTIGLLLRTMPFLLLRLAVYIGIALAYVLMSALGAGIGYGVGSLGSQEFRAGAALIGGLIGMSVVGGIMFWAREYLLYLVKGAHIATLIELMDGRPLPEGRGQISYGAGIVKARFAEASMIFILDKLVKGVLRAIVRMIGGFLSFLPGSDQLKKIMQAFLSIAVGFIDELILAHAIRAKSENAWGSARDALILYGQNWKVMFRNAAWLMVIIYTLGFLIFLLMLAPASLLAYMMPGVLSFAAVVFALLLTWGIKTAVLEPFAVACLMQVYFKTIEGQVPDPEWEARLEKTSSHFRKIKTRAAEAF